MSERVTVALSVWTHRALNVTQCSLERHASLKLSTYFLVVPRSQGMLRHFAPNHHLSVANNSVPRISAVGGLVASRLLTSQAFEGRTSKLLSMRCAVCHQDKPDVRLRPEFCPGYLCGLCYEHDKAFLAFRLATTAEEKNLHHERMDELEAVKLRELRRPTQVED